jgi:hypothetical protein
MADWEADPTEARSAIPTAAAASLVISLLLTARVLITHAVTRSRIHQSGGVDGIKGEGIPRDESVNEIEAFDKTSVTEHRLGLG